MNTTIMSLLKIILMVLNFAKRHLAPFNKIGNGLKNFIFMNFGGITKIQICIKFC